MKKILFLLFISIFTYADNIAELEHAIIKSDFNAVEQILGQDIGISAFEQMALIDLASEIIKKRENKILIHEMDVVSEKHPQLKYLKENKELEVLLSKCLDPFGISLLATVASLCVFAAAPSSSAFQTIGACCAATSGVTSLITLLGGLLYFTAAENKVIAKHKTLLSAQHKAAIKIKQLIFKIKAVPN